MVAIPAVSNLMITIFNFLALCALESVDRWRFSAMKVLLELWYSVNQCLTGMGSM